MSPFRDLNRVLPALLLFSLISNLSVLISPIFMMQVLDRVIPSGNLNTLALLFLLVLAALALQTVVEAARDLSCARLGRWVDAEGTQTALSARPQDAQPNIDLVGRASAFLSGQQIVTALNLPWLPLLALSLALLHPWFLLLLAGLLGANFAQKQAVSFLTRASRSAGKLLARKEARRFANLEEAAQRPGLSVIAFHLLQDITALRKERAETLASGDPIQSLGHSASSVLRSLAQISTLCLGALLVTLGELTAGGMIAASILLAKSYTTAEAALTQGPQLKAAWADLRALQDMSAAQAPRTENADFAGHLRAEGLIFPRGGGAPPRLDRISLDVKPGQCLVILGPSGSGKSTLLAALSGQSPSPIGAVFYDQSEVKSLSHKAFQDHFGFLDQYPTLLAGTIAENICSFRQDATAEQTIEAAKRVGVHGLIAALPAAYETDLGKEKQLLSEGQKQRIALARAIYNRPRYLFLDEPNALLDAESERAFLRALTALKDSGTTIVMVLHRSGLMGLADRILRLEHGRAIDFGDRTEVLGRMAIGRRQIDLPLLESSQQDLTEWIGAQFTRDGDTPFRQKAQLAGEEMFTAARENGAQAKTRKAQITFTFSGDTECEIMLIEKALPEDVDLSRLKAVVRKPPLELAELRPNERAMANLMRLTDLVDLQEVENSAVFRAKVSCATNGSARPVDLLL